jgi:hypothetical protein
MTQESTTARSAAPSVPMTAEQRATFERDGYLIIRGALYPDEVAGAHDAIDRVYACMAKAGSLGPDGSMHLLSAVANCPEVAGLTDHPATFPNVWSTLGWNIHVYHSHLDVHPPVRVSMPFRFDWHQDGGRQNREIETTPRPRLSVKLAYWLSDLTEPGRGNLKVVPGSHVVNPLEVSHAHMNRAYDNGDAVLFAQAVPWLVRYDGSWWVVYERGWLRVTDEPTATDIDQRAAQITEAEAKKSRDAAIRAAVASQTGQPSADTRNKPPASA